MNMNVVREFCVNSTLCFFCVISIAQNLKTVSVELDEVNEIEMHVGGGGAFGSLKK